jgi:hypothetical protein
MARLSTWNGTKVGNRLMPMGNDLYDKGTPRYAERHYAAAEVEFRRLLNVIPPGDGPARGRAAYGYRVPVAGRPGRHGRASSATGTRRWRRGR